MSTRHPALGLLAGALLGATLVAAQEPAPAPETATAPPAPSALPEPEYEGVVFYREPETGALVELERVEALPRERSVSGGIERFLEVPGAKSAVRFARKERPVLVVRAPSRSKDPHAIFSLVAFQTRRDKRVLILQKIELPARQVVPVPLPKVALQIEKYGASSFELRPVQLWRPGEYCVSSDLTRFLFCFGAD